MILGEQLKENRQQLKMTQQELAEKMHVSRQTISNWEVGRSYPDIESLILLSDLFSISLDKLLKGDREMITSLKKKSKMEIFYRILMGTLLLSGVINIIVDLAVNKKLYWSPIVLVSELLVGIFFSIIFLAKKERLLKSWLSVTVLLLPIQWMIQNSVTKGQWVSEYGVKLSAIWLMYSWLLILLWRFTKIRIWWLLTIAGLLGLVGNYFTLLSTGTVDSLPNYFSNFIVNGLSVSIVTIIFSILAITNVGNNKIDEWLFTNVRNNSSN